LAFCAQQVLIAACGELEEADDGVVLAPDGDPFPSWPQDHPGLSGDGPGAAYEARASAAETLRAYGNEAFKKGDFAAADAKYTKALRYLEHAYTREAETLHEEAAARRTQVALSVPLLLNAAAARLRLRDGRGAVAACDAVAALEDDALGAALGVTKRQNSSVAANSGGAGISGNAKALFRRGAGLALCREFEAAERDLERAAALAPGDAAVARELARVRAAAAARKGRERAAFAAAFAAGGER
jgi:peptidyl-prolyl isomerase D